MAGLSPATQSPDGSREPSGTATPADSPIAPWLFWSGLGGFALLVVLLSLVRRRVPYGEGSSETGTRREGASAPGDGSNDRGPGGPDDD